MKYGLILMILLFLGVHAYAQKENLEGKKSEFKIKPIPEKKTSKSSGSSFSIGRSLLPVSEKKHWGMPDKPKLGQNNDKKNKVDMTKGEGYVKRTIKFKPGYLKKNGEGKMDPSFSKPQDLGSFYTDGKFVTVSWRDAQVVDGDRVDIIVNGTVVVHNVTLLSSYHSIQVPVTDGFTKIEFKALNQGQSGPNTADFKVENETGRVMTHGEWNLATGVKAHLLIIKNN